MRQIDAVRAAREQADRIKRGIATAMLEDQIQAMRTEIEVRKATAKLDSALMRASKFAAETSGTCPYDMFGFQAKCCGEECTDSYAECWRRYFEREGE